MSRFGEVLARASAAPPPFSVNEKRESERAGERERERENSCGDVGRGFFFLFLPLVVSFLHPTASHSPTRRVNDQSPLSCLPLLPSWCAPLNVRLTPAPPPPKMCPPSPQKTTVRSDFQRFCNSESKGVRRRRRRSKRGREGWRRREGEMEGGRGRRFSSCPPD